MISNTHGTVLAWNGCRRNLGGRRVLKHQIFNDFTPVHHPRGQPGYSIPASIFQRNKPFLSKLTPSIFHNSTIIFWLGSPRSIYTAFFFFASRKPFPWILFSSGFFPPPTWASRLQPGRPFPNCEGDTLTLEELQGFDYNGHLKNKRKNYHHICINSESYRLSVCTFQWYIAVYAVYDNMFMMCNGF